MTRQSWVKKLISKARFAGKINFFDRLLGGSYDPPIVLSLVLTLLVLSVLTVLILAVLTLLILTVLVILVILVILFGHYIFLLE